MSEEPAPPRADPVHEGDISPEIDWRLLPLPSDDISLGSLRVAADNDPKILGALVRRLVAAEQLAAEDIFDAALRPSPQDGTVRIWQELKEATIGVLADVYKRTGLGSRQAAEMVRQLESSVTAQARKHIPDRPR
jgi:hypothetical protein